MANDSHPHYAKKVMFVAHEAKEKHEPGVIVGIWPDKSVSVRLDAGGQVDNVQIAEASAPAKVRTCYLVPESK